MVQVYIVYYGNLWYRYTLYTLSHGRLHNCVWYNVYQTTNNYPCSPDTNCKLHKSCKLNGITCISYFNEDFSILFHIFTTIYKNKV